MIIRFNVNYYVLGGVIPLLSISHSPATLHTPTHREDPYGTVYGIPAARLGSRLSRVLPRSCRGGTRAVDSRLGV